VNDHLAQAGADHQPDPYRIVTPQDFGRELTLLRSQADLTVRQVARAAGLPASTAGDYFSGRHLPAAGQAGALHKILAACGETDPDGVARWAPTRPTAAWPASRPRMPRGSSAVKR
jgi:transcriptional regulator with XRE-family HTH domain